MTTGRHQRIVRLEAMLEQVRYPQCAIVSYGLGLDDIVKAADLDDVIDAAIAAQGLHARRCVALPGKLSRQEWIVMAQVNQGAKHAAGYHPL